MADRELGTGAGSTQWQAYLSMTLTFVGPNNRYDIQFDRMHNQYSPNEKRTITLTQGAANTITPPTGAAGVVIVPPSTNTQPYVVEGVAGDTGFPEGKIGISSHTFDNPPVGNFVVTLAAGTNKDFEFWYW